jgi:hypothetical protein
MANRLSNQRFEGENMFKQANDRGLSGLVDAAGILLLIFFFFRMWSHHQAILDMMVADQNLQMHQQQGFIGQPKVNEPKALNPLWMKTLELMQEHDRKASVKTDEESRSGSDRPKE